MQKFFQTLINPDHDDDPERSLITNAANILQIGEFQLLQLAYNEWHGSEVSGPELDQLFGDYMLRQRVTHWMRHYARNIVDLYASGNLDIDAPDYHRYDHTYHHQHGRRKFITAVAFLTVAIFGSILLSYLSIQHSGSVFPPYFDSKELNTPLKHAGNRLPSPLP